MDYMFLGKTFGEFLLSLQKIQYVRPKKKKFRRNNSILNIWYVKNVINMYNHINSLSDKKIYISILTRCSQIKIYVFG